MKKLLALVALLPSVALAQPVTYNVDGAHSQSAFSVKHLVISTVRGEFARTEGTVVIDDADVTRSKVEATIDVASINTREPKRDEHLKSADFFDAAKFPKITFKSTKVEKAGEGKLKVAGDLTIKGVTKPVVLDVTGPTKEVKDPWGNVKRGAAATTTINRKDFGMSWGAVIEAGPVVGDEVQIQIDLELTRAAAPKK